MHASRALYSLICTAMLCLSLPAQYPSAKPFPKELAESLNSITPEYCREVLTFLAGPECAGRGSGQAGYQVAADYVAKQFKAFGLKSAPKDGSYFQMVPFERSRTSLKSTLTCKTVSLEVGKDLFLRPSEQERSAQIIFIGGGEEAVLDNPKVLRDKIVILFGPAATGYQSGVRRQMRRDRPAAVLTVSKAIDQPAWQARPKRERRSNRRRSPRVQGTITMAGALRLAKELGVNEAALSTSLFSGSMGGKNLTVAAPEDAEGTFKISVQTEDVMVPNVCGYIEGSDPELKDEWVICGSHLDHLGVAGDGTIRPGADDDGSGSTALIALAKAMSSSDVKPRRSVLFLAFCAEEMGLIGSAYYVNNPLFPLDKATCELQMDMVGRNEEKRARGKRKADKPEDNIMTTHLVGSKRISGELHSAILKMNEHIGFEFEYDEESVYTRSDHYNFAKKGIPIAFVFSGFHPDYHKPTDTVDKINFDKIANTAKLIYLVAMDASQRDEMYEREK